MIIDSLRRLPLFADLPEADLEWLSERAQPLRVEAGSILIHEGEPGNAAYIVLSGEFEVVKKSGRQDIVIAVREPGEVFGEMALIDEAPRNATVRAVQAGDVLRISGETFKSLLAHSPSASFSILQTVSRRLQQNQGMLRQSEKMAALGTLAAGLAHELNNPAAAVRRSAEQIKSALATWGRATTALQQVSLNPEQVQRVGELRTEIEAPRSGLPLVDPLEQSDQEAQLESWLEQHRVGDPWQITSALVSAGWDTTSVALLEGIFPGEALVPLLRWLASGLAVYSLLDQLGMGSERISEIVRAVKAYSYLDQAPVQQVNVHEGLENTLVILRHKLTNIQVERQYAPDLPRIEAHGSELNQVWTNILDNAIYAMGGRGLIHLKTYAHDDHVVVELQDNGPGIPAEIQQRVFEPFFTTKPPGIGTGLGLHIVYSIINNHGGRIHISSQPGNTCFQVTLPVQLPH